MEVHTLPIRWLRVVDPGFCGQSLRENDCEVATDAGMTKERSFADASPDTTKGQHQFFITGSARLDVYRRGGDSLLGRYHYWRLHPLTLSEPIFPALPVTY